MKQCSFSTIIAITLMCMTFTSCSYVRWVGVERLTPAKIDLPERVRRVAVLNNQPMMEEESNSIYYLDSRIVVDSLAQYLADAAYFDEVVISDTVLNSNMLIDYNSRELRPTIVMELCRRLGVDMLVTVDYVAFLPNEVELPYVTGGVRVRMTCYREGEIKPVASIKEEAWMDWQRWNAFKASAVSLSVAKALSTIAPQWQIEEFSFYTGANVWQRDAAVYVREGNWDGAANLWRQQLTHKNRRRRMEAHLNMAVYHEMRDDNVEMARTHAQKALELSEEGLKMKNGRPVEPTRDYLLISEYMKNMERRGHDLERLKQQMYRFSNEF